MTDKIVVLSTCASEQEAEKLARSMVEQHLAACVNVVPRVRSYYRWQGTIECGDEYLLIIKSSRDRMAELLAYIEKEHSYEVAEAIALPLIDGAPNYLNWLQASLTEEG